MSENPQADNIPDKWGVPPLGGNPCVRNVRKGASIHHEKKGSRTMLTETETEAALALMSMATNPTMMRAMDGEIRTVIPGIEAGELAALWQEAGERHLDAME